MKEIAFYNSSWRNAPLAFIGAGVFILVLLARDPTANSEPLDYGGLFFFGSIAMLFGGRLLDTRPRVVISERGILDSRGNLGIIEWPEISEVAVGSAGSIQQLIVHVRRRDFWLNKSSGFTKFLWRLYGREKFVVKINLQNMTPDARSAEELINEMLSLHKANNPLNKDAPKDGAPVS